MHKRILILFILCVLPAFAQVPLLKNPAYLASLRKPAAAGGGPCEGPQGSPLIHEGFEGAGTEESGWVNSGADFDYTTTVLAGSHSCALDGTAANENFYRSDSSASERHYYFMFRCVGGLASVSTVILNLQTSGFASLATFALNSDGTFGISHGSVDTDVGTYSADTTYHVWLRYKAGSGANGELEFYYATSATKPGSPTHTITTGTSTGNVAVQQYFSSLNLGRIVIFDNLITDDEVICSNPF